ncbi:MAG: hypothetical protein Q9202_006940 [Teloschistes flavicans]
MAEEHVTTEQLSEGLDRAPYAVYHNADRHLITPLQPDDTSSTDGSGDGRFHHLSAKLKHVKKKTNLLFHPNKATDEPTATVPLLAPPPVTQDQEDRLFHDAPEQKRPDIKEVFKNPISTVQSVLHGASGAKFAETMDNQVISHGAEVRLVRAYDELKDAPSKERKVKAADNLEDLKKARQDSFLLRYQIEHYGDRYIDANPNLPTPSEEALNTTVERLIMTSTPYQMLLMKVRHVYRWDDPSKTAKYLAAYTLLWAFDYISGAAILALIWLVLKRRLYPPTLEDVREEIKRSEDVDLTALNITQLIEQHGSHGWTDALRQDLGPWLLLQLEDLANILEIWRNFYEWREPRRTTITLVLLSILWLAITIVPLHLLIKISQFNFGIVFFGLFPIATRYPQYRLLASPMKWLFWRVPTDAEWAITRLQVEAQHRKDAMRQADLDQNTDHHEKNSVVSLGKYHCTSGSHHGDLHVNSDGVQYISAVRKNLLWELLFENVVLMQKVSTGDGLRFVDTKDVEFRVAGLKSRNEIFTQIVGYSGIRWQVSG